jgi:uncharacterized protein (TIGR02118 family)
MLKMLVLYKTPDDAEAFEKRYVEGHLPIVRGYGNVKDTTFEKVTRTIMGEFPYSHIFTGTWADKDGWKADMNSDLAKKATEDAKSFAPEFDVVVVEEIA